MKRFFLISATIFFVLFCENKTFAQTPLLIFPNAFVPSTSGSNGGRWNEKSTDIFHPLYQQGAILKYHLKIFNRNGTLVFETKEPEIGWDGYFRGQLAPCDVYLYKCEVQFSNGKTDNLVGDVTLLR